MSDHSLPPPFDHTGLPVGLPEPVYVSWLAARRDFHLSQDAIQGELHYQFCCGYVQALQDAQVIDERYGAFIKAQLREIWLGILGHLPGVL